MIDSLAARFGDAPALLFPDQNWSFRDLAHRANQYARWALAIGLARGDVVCLMMPNRPDYLAIWLGITRVGGVAALVNTNLMGDALVRSIGSVGAGHVIVDESLAHAVASVRPRLSTGVRCWVLGDGGPDFLRLDREIEQISGDTVTLTDSATPRLSDRALYLYTSGTTGLPKATTVSHLRVMQWTHWFAGMMGTGPRDRMYDCLPMYHSIGGIVAIGAALVGGGSVVLRQRFSASQFWDDVVTTECTLFQYIGELCRYLVNAPPHPKETQHRLRLCCGSGLSAEIWDRFQGRFHIPRILEFYAATEGAVSLYNCEGKQGAIGRIPPYLVHRFPVALVRHDVATGEPVRGADGHCIRCAADETGEAVGPVNDFDGYADPLDSDRKLLREVFQRGDRWFRTGDLMRRDKAGYFFFVDRIGDTFRWKGENVSTTEVTSAVCASPGVNEAVVYGVSVPGAEGRAGMAAITVGPDFDLATLWRTLAQRLPEYARPLFLRLCTSLETTATYRPQKQALARDGFDPAATRDPLYFNDNVAQTFVPLDAALYRRIADGEVRL